MGRGWREDDREVVGGERSVFHCVSSAPQWLLSTVTVMSSRCSIVQPFRRSPGERGMLSISSGPLGRRMVAPDLPQPAEAAVAVSHWICVETCVYISINSPLIVPPQHTTAIWSYLQREGYFLRALTSTVQIYCQWQNSSPTWCSLIHLPPAFLSCPALLTKYSQTLMAPSQPAGAFATEAEVKKRERKKEMFGMGAGCWLGMTWAFKKDWRKSDKTLGKHGLRSAPPVQ